MGEIASGHLIVVTGVPSAGKTTISQGVAARSSFRYLDGDAFLRAHPPPAIAPPPLDLSRYAEAVLKLMLAEIEDRLHRESVVLDMILPGSYVERIQGRFGARAMFVLLTVGPAEQQRREARRGRPDPHRGWAASRADLLGPRSLYDLTLDTTTRSPASCADQIVAVLQGRGWSPGALGRAERDD